MYDKKSLRQTYKALRETHREHLATYSEAICSRLCQNLPPTLSCLAGYLATPTEVSVDPILEQYLSKTTVVIPKAYKEQGRPSSYGLAQWQKNKECLGPYGIREPQSSIATYAPEIWLVPGLAFDLSGTRLGYGKGIYDRLLEQASTSSLYIGICPSFGLAPALPYASWDIPMDIVVTEVGMHVINGNKVSKHLSF